MRGTIVLLRTNSPHHLKGIDYQVINGPLELSVNLLIEMYLLLTRMRVGIDLEEVQCGSYEIYKREGEEGDFVELTQPVWEESPLDYPLKDPSVPQAMEMLHQDYELVVLTNRTGVREQIETWLSHYQIPYDELQIPGGDKGECDVDVLVDDMIWDVPYLVLRETHENTDDRDKADTTVSSLAEAVPVINGYENRAK